MNALKMCLNWKVIALLAVVAIASFVYVPEVASKALPFLVLLICPLSMIFMMRATSGMSGDASSGRDSAKAGSGQEETKKHQLSRLRVHQQEIADEIAALEKSR